MKTVFYQLKLNSKMNYRELVFVIGLFIGVIIESLFVNLIFNYTFHHQFMVSMIDDFTILVPTALRASFS